MTAAAAALAGLRVVDISSTEAGAWCTRLLADFGAEVILVEPPGGHALRHRQPRAGDGTSIVAEYFLAGKRSVVLDLRDADGPSLARSLIARAAVVVSSARPAELASMGLRFEDLRQPALLMAHVTPWGMTGDLAEAPGNDLAVSARSGWASINGDAAREPLKPSGWQVSYCTGVAAFAAILAALHEHRLSGTGQEIDIAALDVMTAAFAPALLRSVYQGEPLGRKAEADLQAGPVPVADGFFALTISRAHFWRDAMTVLGLTDLAEDTRWEAGWYRQAHKHEYTSRVLAKMRTWTKWRLFHELAVRRVIAGPVVTMAELVSSEHLRARGFWVRTEDAAGDGETPFPGAPFRMGRTPWRLGKRAPALGGDGDEILGELRR